MTMVMTKSLNVKVRYFVASLSLMIGLVSSALAEGPAIPAGGAPTGAQGSSAPQQAGGIMQFMPFLLMFGVLYFLVLRPQQKKMKEQQAMINSLKHGDEVVTASGILGKVTGITDKVVTIEVADGVRM